MNKSRQAGFRAVWDDGNEVPVKKSERVTEPPATCREPDEWKAGNRMGMKMVRAFMAGYRDGRSRSEGKTSDKQLTSYYWRGYRQGLCVFYTKAIIPVLKDVKLNYILETYIHPCPEDDMPGSVTRKRIGKKELLDGAVSNLVAYGKDEPMPPTLGKLLEHFREDKEGDGMWCHCNVVPLEEARKEAARRKFKELEEAAGWFASQCGFQMNTMKFLRALERAVRTAKDRQEQFNSGEARMERWGACMCAGVGSEVYFDDGNFENGRFVAHQEKLGKVFAYIEKKFPLLMMKYREKQLRREKK